MQQTQKPVQVNSTIVQKPVSTTQVQQKSAQTVQKKPELTEQAQKPVSQPGVQKVTSIKKKPTKWWIWILVILFIAGGIAFAYFQFLK